ncbi:LOW QUALITY PROTEIN: pantetheinase [Glossophaga mutica]
MIEPQLLAHVAISVFCVLKASSLDTFIAAVYELAVLLLNDTQTPVSREESVFRREWSQQQPDRWSICPFLEDIPDPQVNWILCNHPNRFGHTPGQERLSCLAKDNSIYIAANTGDKKPCNACDPKCPFDGCYQYNGVVFDSQGKLVARYHKQSLWGEEQLFNIPKEPEVVTFNTVSARLGIFTWFDFLFHDPAVTLVRDLHADTVLFPSNWVNIWPHFSSCEFHSAWALSVRVNLLASNTRPLSKKITGSGIYAPDSPRAFHDMTTKEGKLLSPPLGSHPTHPVVVNWTTYASGIDALSMGNQEFQGTVFLKFIFLEFRGVSGIVCQKDLCCHLPYKMCEKRSDEVYALKVFGGLHKYKESYYLPGQLGSLCHRLRISAPQSAPRISQALWKVAVTGVCSHEDGTEDGHKHGHPSHDEAWKWHPYVSVYILLAKTSRMQSSRSKDREILPTPNEAKTKVEMLGE